MESVIQKATKGNRGAMTLLYESCTPAVYCLSKALLRGSKQSIDAANWAIRSTFQATEKGLIRTEEEFCSYAVKQAAGYCKKEVLKKDPRAFKLPPRKEFRISHVNEQTVMPADTDIEACIRCLPAIQRFAFVLRYMGNMDMLQLGKIIGLDTGVIEMIFEAESENLARISRALNAAGVRCELLTKEQITEGIAEVQAAVLLPDTVRIYIENYIDSIATPIEAAAKNKGKKLAVIGGAILVCVAILIAATAGSGNSYDSTVSDGDYIEDSVTGSEDMDTTDTTDGSTTANDLDPDTIYYADIEVENYGTITVQLDQSVAPITAANFVSLAESGFYDGLTFHRIYSGFMIQGGDPNGDGTGGSDEEIVGEFANNGHENDLSHIRGVISMARSGDDYNSASSQFFIVHEDSDFLDGDYAAFGWVTEGMDIVDAICEDAEPYDDNGMIYAEDQPVITSITIRTESIDSTETEETDTETE